jgi:predicted metal-dependent hydrolase
VTEPEYVAFVECWNDGRFFEAHEVLEGLWVRTHDRRQQGLIQMAAALYHLQRGNLKGARTMIDRALPRLRDARAAASPVDAGSVCTYAEWLRSALENIEGRDLIASRPRL